MDNDRRRGMCSCEEQVFNRIISRNPSIGCSSRIYYYRSSQGVPFNWEMQPGIPKETRKEDTLPPISPPPALLSLGLPKPRIDIAESDRPKPWKLIRVFKFWKHGKRKNGVGNVKKIDHADKYNSSYEMSSSDDDGEFDLSPRRMSSSSSSSSFSNGSPSPAREKRYGCSPLHFSSFGGRVSRSRLR